MRVVQHIKVLHMVKARGGAGTRAARALPAVTFRRSALAVMRRVRDTGVPVTVTSRGRPLVHIVAPRGGDAEPTGCGCMRDTCELHALEVVAFPSRAPHPDAPGADQADADEE
jgi:prevent-host-death family protein